MLCHSLIWWQGKVWNWVRKNPEAVFINMEKRFKIALFLGRFERNKKYSWETSIATYSLILSQIWCIHLDQVIWEFKWPQDYSSQTLFAALLVPELKGSFSWGTRSGNSPRMHRGFPLPPKGRNIHEQHLQGWYCETGTQQCFFPHCVEWCHWGLRARTQPCPFPGF